MSFSEINLCGVDIVGVCPGLGLVHDPGDVVGIVSVDWALAEGLFLGPGENSRELDAMLRLPRNRRDCAQREILYKNT